jgi:predicted aldo/keto reductase-like oxidoreductase
MQDALTYLSASDEEKDYSSAISESQVGLAGSCMYCNHCLPCPSRINIAEMTRLADSAAYGVSDEMKGKYDAIAYKASACIQCGACMKRCPFGVDVISNMERAVALFEG